MHTYAVGRLQIQVYPVRVCVSRSHAVFELFSQDDLSLADVETAVLRNNLTEMLESGILGLVNTFCVNPGTSLQVTTKLALALALALAVFNTFV